MMKCLVLVLMVLACLEAAAGASTSCAGSREFLAIYNVSADDSDSPGPVCGGQCCGRGRETQLQGALRREVERRTTAITQPVADMLLSTQRTLREHLTSLSRQSQNETAVLLSRMYPSHTGRAHATLAAFYDDVRILLQPSSDQAALTGSDLGTPSPKDLGTSTRKFFRDLFPVAYHNVLMLDAKQFTPEYEVCLKDAYDVVQPFGDVPQQLGSRLSRSLEVARALLQVVAVGAAALTESEQVVTRENDACAQKLLRVGACAPCRGHSARPCRSYCLNVARGCIGSLVADLDAPWSSYVEAVERLSRTDADAALRDIDKRISEAIMHALKNKAVLEEKVRQECGPPSTVEVQRPTSPRPTPGANRRDPFRAPPPDTVLLQFAAFLAANKKLFVGLADSFCDETDFADKGNEQCWNGETVGEYSKPLASLSDQKYNPEITDGVPEDTRVVAIGDRLIRARQVLVESWGVGSPSAEPIMQSDEAGEEESGSGYNSDDDAEFDAEGSGEGSGSDEGPRTRVASDPGESETTTQKTGAATTSLPLYSIVLLAVLLSTCFSLT